MYAHAYLDFSLPLLNKIQAQTRFGIINMVRGKEITKTMMEVDLGIVKAATESTQVALETIKVAIKTM
jgi:hypothetical protein